MPSATGRPARSFGLPSASTSSSPKPALTWPATASATAFVSAWVRYGVSVTVSFAFPNRAASAGLSPGATASLSTDGRAATRGRFVVTSQPRTSTCCAPSAADREARSASRFRPYSRTIGSRVADVDGAGAPDAFSGVVNCSSPWSSTRTCAPLSAARNCRKSQSDTFACESCW
ncbi:hypothetical protein SHKM778_11380 [Streptomyces sp. KM77-8]|uniref:Uncharacterized protein n=1 Tax=Streptomyces haneummycinicus TaxID=3074435 RepID=A0AAT9HBQ7_9ACTN